MSCGGSTRAGSSTRGSSSYRARNRYADDVELTVQEIEPQQTEGSACLFKKREANYLKAPVIEEPKFSTPRRLVLSSRVDTNESFHSWSDGESLEQAEPESSTTLEDYAMHSVYARESETNPVATPEQLEAARKEINESKQRVDKRLRHIENTLSESHMLLGCTKRFAEKFKKASKGGRISSCFIEIE